MTPFSPPIPSFIQPLSLPSHPRIPSITSPLREDGNALPAGERFGKLPDSSLILATTRRGDFSQAFHLFTEMSKSGWTPDEFTLGSLLKATSVLSDATIGEQLHAKSIRSGLATEPGVRTSLITMYANCRLLDSARQVFDETPQVDTTDVPTWNSIISANVLHGRYPECFLLFAAMISISHHLIPSDATYSIMLGACASTEEIKIGRVLHARIIKDGMVQEIKMLNSLITLYSKCGELGDARKVFDATDGTNIVSWNAMIAGYEQNGECELALALFRQLSAEQLLVRPNRITFLSGLSAASAVSTLKLGREVHAKIIRSGLECETSIANSLITLYGKCSEVVTGRLIFERLPAKDVVSWNSMLVGYSQNRQPENCYKLFEAMQSMGIKSDDHSLTILLGASNSCRLGREIHGKILRRLVAKKPPQVSVHNAILTMYARSGRIGDMEKVFGGMGERDSYSWNATMDGYSMNGCYRDAIKMFVDFLNRGLQADYLTFSILLTACGRLASIELGRQFHALTLKHHCRHQFRLSNSKTSLLSISNALVSMYSKCGSIHDAAKAFQGMVRRDVFSWTAMITGYAHHGMAYESLSLFEGMRRDGVEPNSITFLGLLTACAHAGLVEEGTHYFSLTMNKASGKEPSIEHYACMVDLFGRSGQFERAEAMVVSGISQLGLKHSSCLGLWKVLLAACHAHKQLELGVKVAARILELEPEEETTHVLLSNLYAAFGMWGDAVAVRRRMRERGLKKEAGCSWVEVGKRRHVFAAGDVSHPDRKEIYEKLEELDERFRGAGYIPLTEFVLHDVDEEQKEVILGCHSEKLAVSFALLNDRTGKGRGVIRVIKNLRVCGDCHNWMKFASQVEGQEILLRDSRRFHLFQYGNCSCGDYW